MPFLALVVNNQEVFPTFQCEKEKSEKAFIDMVSFTWGYVLPYAAMVMMVFTDMSTVILSKAAMSKGLSIYVLVTYSHALSTVLLLPCFILQKKVSVSFAFLSTQFISSLIGGSSMFLGYNGINYSSPTLFSAIGNLSPIFTFILAIIFRMEKLDLRNSSCQAKVLGTVISVSGAFVVILYKGSMLFSPSNFSEQNFIMVSQQSNWVLGGVMLVIGCILYSTWTILQTSIVKNCPSMLTVVFFYLFFETIQSTVFSLFMESNSNAWILKPDIKMISIVCSAVFGAVFHVGAVTWCLSQKGPIFVTMFKPLGVAIAAVMAFIFLGDAVYLGSVIGSVIIAIGFYAMLWGQMKDKTAAVMENDVHSMVSSTEKTPLL